MTEQNEKPTILPPEMRGTMSITGLRGYGKSFLASQADLPNNIMFVDFENKGAGIDNQLQFGSYFAPVQESSDPLSLYRNVQSIVDSIEQDRFTVLVFDNVSPLELALNAEASNNAEKYSKLYGLNLKNIKAGRFGGTKAVTNFMISDMCNRIHGKGIKLIITTSHMSKRWSTGGIIPNKYNAKGADRWQELSILTLILIGGKYPPIPSALVQKEQLGTISIDSNPNEEQLEKMKRGEIGHEIARRLPPKIAKCNFQEIRHYLYHPANFGKLTDDEIPTEEEADPYRERLNKEQMTIVLAAADIQRKQEKEDDEITELLELEEVKNKEGEARKKIENLIESDSKWADAASPAIAKELGMTIPEVAKLLAEIRK